MEHGYLKWTINVYHQMVIMPDKVVTAKSIPVNKWKKINTQKQDKWVQRPIYYMHILTNQLCEL